MFTKRLQTNLKPKPRVFPFPEEMNSSLLVASITSLVMPELKVIVQDNFKEVKKEIVEASKVLLQEALLKESRDLKKRSFKGDKGDKGDVGKDSMVVGPKGDNGPKGEMGPQGKDGSPDKPLDIAYKLNTLTEEVDQSVIRGLKDWMSKVQKRFEKGGGGSGGNGGGGMGLWVHESFATTSATTSVTIVSNVAANSNAILVRYNGQLLNHGVQYTIIGKIITFTFTLDDDSNVGVTYVRT